METVASMSPIVGQQVAIKFEKVSVECRIIDSRQVWNRVDILVEPMWVSRDRIAEAR